MELLPLPRLESLSVRAANALVGRSRTVAFPIGGQTYRLEFTYMPEPEVPAEVIHLAVGPESWWIGLGRINALPALQTLTNGGQFTDLPRELQPAVLMTAFGPVLDAIAAQMGADVTVREVVSREQVRSVDVGWSVTLNEPATARMNGWLGLSRRAAVELSKWVQKAPPRPAWNLAALPVPLRLVYGETELSAAEFRSLQPFDVIVVDQLAGGSADHIAVRPSSATNWQWIGNLTASQIVVERFMKTPTEAAPAQPAAADMAQLLDGLPVRVSFDLGELQLSLQELSTLKAGYTFELATPKARPVTIRANGQPVARGEIVQIGEQIGVRLVEVGHGNA